MLSPSYNYVESLFQLRWLSGKDSACQCRRHKFDPQVEDPEGTGNPLQYSCLETSIDRGAWWATVHGIAKESGMTQQIHNNNLISVSSTDIMKDQIKCFEIHLCHNYIIPIFNVRIKKEEQYDLALIQLFWFLVTTLF